MNNTHNADIQLKESIDFFKSHKIWSGIFEGFRRKYQSYGRLAGTVTVNNLSAEDVVELEGFFGQNFHGKKSISISAGKFSVALAQSKYNLVDPVEVLNGFFGEDLIGNAEKKAIREDLVGEITDEIHRSFFGTAAADNFNELEIIVQKMLRLSVFSCCDADFELWRNTLRWSGEIYNALPYRRNQKKYLPVFSAEITGNPHAFDVGTSLGKLLYQIVQMDLKLRNLEVDSIEEFPAYKRQKSFLLEGILIDDISNYALLYNVRGIKKDGRVHLGMEGFCQEKSVLYVPLNVLSEWERIECENNKIIVVENPSVFALLCGDNSCMCVNGQPKLASLVALELMEKSGTEVYYSGDLDPEGLMIAQKLGRFYKCSFRFWHMGEADYSKCISEEVLSERRLKMLDKIVSPELQAVADKMKKEKRAGYQENFVVQNE